MYNTSYDKKITFVNLQKHSSDKTITLIDIQKYSPVSPLLDPRASPAIKPTIENNFASPLIKGDEKNNLKNEYIINHILDDDIINHILDYDIISLREREIQKSEEKDVPVTELTNNIVYLNFENDETFIPLFQLSQEYNKFYEELYRECEIYYDIEDSNIYYHNEISRSKLRDFFFNKCGKTHLKNKNILEMEYFPAFINKCSLDIRMEEIEFKMNKTGKYNATKENTTDKKSIVEKMKITIPSFVEKTPPKFKFPISDIKSSTTVYNYSEYSDNDDNKSSNNIIVSVLFNYNELYTIVKEYKKSGDCSELHFTTKVLNECPEYGFIELLHYETTDANIVSQMKYMFHKKSFVDVKELNEQLCILEKFYQFISETLTQTVITANNEDTKVRNLVEYNFDIDDNKENRMKASQLIDFVINNDRLDSKPLEGDNNYNNYRIRISKDLIKMGLKKHRYSDGYYYYGIKRKKLFYEELPKDALLNIIEKREDQLRTIYK